LKLTLTSYKNHSGYEIRAARELPSREVERAKGSILDII